MSKRVLVTGASGFIGSHLCKRLRASGDCHVIGLDISLPAYSRPMDLCDEFYLTDLRIAASAASHINKVDEVYALAADMGGMGYISSNHVNILRNNLLINLNTIEAASKANVHRYFYASSACVYPDYLQAETDNEGLREEDAYPAAPQDAYGWEKLTSEKLAEYYRDERHLPVRIARFHNVYGPLGCFDGGREKAPAALCRKIATAKLLGNDSIDVWGDGKQTRSFLYVDDCIEGILRLVESSYASPLNLGSSRAVDIDSLALMIMRIAGVELELHHVDGPQGVRGRNSDNSRTRLILGWMKTTSLEEGLMRTYEWIEERVAGKLQSP